MTHPRGAAGLTRFDPEASGPPEHTGDVRGRRAQAREARHAQLIDATVRCLAEKGYSAMTVADVAAQAGLSVGLVNFHFQSKARLLEATLRHVTENYRRAWESAVAAAAHPAEGLAAFVEANLDDKVASAESIAVWFAFWGESSARTRYREICEANDDAAVATVTGLCRRLSEAGSYPTVDPAAVGSALTSLLDGMWLSFMLHPTTTNRDRARRAAFAVLSATFPCHFTGAGWNGRR